MSQGQKGASTRPPRSRPHPGARPRRVVPRGRLAAPQVQHRRLAADPHGRQRHWLPLRGRLPPRRPVRHLGQALGEAEDPLAGGITDKDFELAHKIEEVVLWRHRRPARDRHPGRVRLQQILTHPCTMKHSTPRISTVAAVGLAADKPGFAWKDPEGEHPVLTYDGKPVLEYVRPKFDKELNAGKKDSSISNPTTKVYRRLYDESGTIRLTNGQDGLYPHHRGIFFGFNKVTYGDKQADIWHCRNGVTSGTRRPATRPARGSAGTGEGRWHGKDGRAFATEERGAGRRHADRAGTSTSPPSSRRTRQGAARRRPAARRVPLPRQPGGGEERQGEHVSTSGPDGKGKTGKDAELGPRRAKDKKHGQPAVDGDELRDRRQAVHGLRPRPPGQPEGGPRQRARPTAGSAPTSSTTDEGQAAEGELPAVGAGGQR